MEEYDNDIFLLTNTFKNYNFDDINADIEYVDQDENILEKISVNLNENNELYELQFNSSNFEFNSEDLDLKLSEFESRELGISISNNNQGKFFKDQDILMGSFGNDVFIAESRNNEKNEIFETAFLSSPGSDLYIGTKFKNNFVDYNFLEQYKKNQLGIEIDSASGLEITDNNNFLNFKIDPAPSLSLEIFNDPLIVNKSKKLDTENKTEIDYLENIEYVRLTQNDDTLHIKDQRDQIFDFISGNDSLIIDSKTFPSHIYNFLNIDQFTWRPLDDLGINIKNSDNLPLEYVFDVKEINEDSNVNILFENYDPNNKTRKIIGDYSIEKSHLSTNNDSLNWLNFKFIDPTPEIINQNNPVIQHKFLNDSEDENLIWLQINAFDYRDDGLGFLGLDIDLDWNSNSIEIEKGLFNKEIVFGNNKFPIFQNLGIDDFDQDFSLLNSLRGFSAGSLPVANQGVILGYMKSEVPYNEFARIPFRKKNSQEEFNVKLNINSLPASKAKFVDKQKLLIIGDDSPKALVINSSPIQQNIGSHFLSITKNDLNIGNLVLNIRSINDSPAALIKENLLNIDLLQDKLYEQNLSELFFDEDDSKLSYSLLEKPNWLEIINGSIIKGIPTNNDIGKNKVIISASDGFNSPVKQELNINVINVNDPPEINKKIDLPTISQGQELNYKLTTTGFKDIDINVDTNEKLKFEIIAKQNSSKSLEFINIDKSTGEINIIARNENVGETDFIIRASDNYGLFVDQEVTIKVLNINDPPFKTNNFPEIKNPINVFVDDLVSINISNWFDDLDIDINNNEKITFEILEDDGSGSLKSITDLEISNWIEFNSNKNLLNINAKGENIGNHFFKVNAKDREGLISSSIFSVKVNYINNKPFLNYTEDQIIEKVISKGVESIEIKKMGIQDKKKYIQFNLTEQSEFSIDLPIDLFAY